MMSWVPLSSPYLSVSDHKRTHDRLMSVSRQDRKVPCRRDALSPVPRTNVPICCFRDCFGSLKENLHTRCESAYVTKDILNRLDNVHVHIVGLHCDVELKQG